MANISIPDKYQAGVFKIHSLNLDTVKAIREALDRVVSAESNAPDERANPFTVATAAIQKVSTPSSNPTDLKTITEALVSMYGVKSYRDMKLDEFVEAVADALEVLPNQEFRLPASEKESFTEKLRILLAADVFAVLSKVDDLRTENERVYCHARIMTDLRPVFGQDVGSAPLGMMVMHNLKIAFHESGRKGDHEFFVSLDSDDLLELRRIIDRAETKAKSLRSVLPNMRLFGIE